MENAFWAGSVAILIQVASSLLTFVVLLCLPAGVLAPRPPRDGGGVARLARNALGWILFGTGVVLSLPILPGPGNLLLILGFILLDFPGKERLRSRLFRSRRLGRVVNGVRAFFRRPPLPFVAPEPTPAPETRAE